MAFFEDRLTLLSDLSATGYTCRRIRTGQANSDLRRAGVRPLAPPRGFAGLFWSFQPEGRPTKALLNESAGDASPPLDAADQQAVSRAK
jgi:hypothetical protein